MSPGTERGYVIVRPDDARNNDAGSNVPGEFRQLTEALGGDQLAVTLIRIPAHSDFEQSIGRYHEEIEEIYFVTRGTLTMRFCDEIETVPAPAAVRISPGTASSHRNEGDKDVELWAISRPLGRSESRRQRDASSSSPRSEAKRTRDPVSLARRT
jgi:mannose-6-phosphate isomerase-like protein (cupin superfamily)